MENRFVQVHYEELPKPAKTKGYVWSRIATRMEILKDIHTGVLYCLSAADTGNPVPVMTPLLDTDGKPLTDKSE